MYLTAKGRIAPFAFIARVHHVGMTGIVQQVAPTTAALPHADDVGAAIFSFNESHINAQCFQFARDIALVIALIAGRIDCRILHQPLQDARDFGFMCIEVGENCVFQIVHFHTWSKTRIRLPPRKARISSSEKPRCTRASVK